jgi:riboflavin kinase/FMN adenylyltransferase
VAENKSGLPGSPIYAYFANLSGAMMIHHDISSFSILHTVLTVGIFDGVHLGHRYILEKLKERATQLDGESVVLTLWPHPRMILNQEGNHFKLLNTLEEKINLLEQAGLDHLIIMPFTTELSRLSSCDFIREVLVDKCRISHLLVGYNHRFGRDREGDFEKLKDCAGQYAFGIEQTGAFQTASGKISSTGIRNFLLRGEIQQANSMLGWSYEFSGNVVGGSKLGSSIGFPTANITMDEDYKLMPADGVYAVKAELNGSWYRGMMNMGSRPTVNDDPGLKTIEVHLFDFNRNIYSERIRIRYVARIRDEQKFRGIDSLKLQLAKDRETALGIFDRTASDFGE